MTDEKQPEKFNLLKMLKGPFQGKNYAKVTVFIVCGGVIFLVLAGANALFEKFFPPKPNGSSTAIRKVESGANVQITNNNSPVLKQGIYGELSSADFGVGVFKEVMPNIDLSLGIEKDYDEDELEFKVQTRFKF